LLDSGFDSKRIELRYAFVGDRVSWITEYQGDQESVGKGPRDMKGNVHPDKFGLSTCCGFMRKCLNIKYRKIAAIPSKAHPDKQLEFWHTKLEPLIVDALPKLMVLLYM